jgi:hypothetical protein
MVRSIENSRTVGPVGGRRSGIPELDYPKRLESDDLN